MKDLEQVAQKVGILLGAEIEIAEEKCVVNNKRTPEIQANAVCFSYTLDLNISFERYQENGLAFNKAEIFLLPEECQVFRTALIQQDLPLPSVYRQWQIANPNIISMYLEAIEPPENFAGRLSMALQAINQE